MKIPRIVSDWKAQFLREGESERSATYHAIIASKDLGAISEVIGPRFARASRTPQDTGK